MYISKENILEGKEILSEFDYDHQLFKWQFYDVDHYYSPKQMDRIMPRLMRSVSDLPITSPVMAKILQIPWFLVWEWFQANKGHVVELVNDGWILKKGYTE